MSPTVNEVFRQAIRLEKRSRAFYTRWQRQFASLPVVALLWKEYAQDEASHARLLAQIRLHLTPSQREQEADPEVVEAILRAQSRLQRLSQRKVETFSDALEIAEEVEYSEMNSVLEFLVSHFAPELWEEMIHAQLREHVGRLNSASLPLLEKES